MSRNRRAFTLVELIVMIIVMGIAFASLPMILGVSSESVKNVSDVRGFYHGAAKMQIVLSKPWDDRNVDDFQTGGIYYVINNDECAISALLCCDNDKNRSGHYPGLNRRMCEDAWASGTLGRTGDTDINAFDDLDDFDLDFDSAEGYDINTTVVYVQYSGGTQVSMPTAVSAATTNVKQITVSISDTLGRPLTQYRYYATNIGRPKSFIKRNQ